MPRDIGFAVIGLGMGTHHCKSIEGADGAHLVAVCDQDEDRLHLVAEEYDCRAYDRLDDLLKDDEVSVINIATPSGTHAQVGMASARAGKHLDQAIMGELHSVRFVHGHGTGRLRRAIAEFLAEHPLVARVSPGNSDDGGSGVTIAELKV